MMLKIASPKDIAIDEFGCAETIFNIIQTAFGDMDEKILLSTTELYRKLKAHKKFQQVLDLEAGNVLISPTGYGNFQLTNGHTGIIGLNGKIMSADSATGLFMENYTIDSWIERYRKLGGFPMFVFKRVL